MKYILDVPYSEKNEAKEAGAKWDSSIKRWVVYSDNENCDYLVEMFNGYTATPKTNVWKYKKTPCLIVDD